MRSTPCIREPTCRPAATSSTPYVLQDSLLWMMPAATMMLMATDCQYEKKMTALMQMNFASGRMGASSCLQACEGIH